MSAESEIRRRISQRGSITFAEFMEVALYHSDGGYYTGGHRVGASGDFYTSPSAHPAFGALLAAQLFQMWQLLERPMPFTVVEPGADDGLLCRDIIAAAAWLPDGFARALRYVCIDHRRHNCAERGLEQGLPGASRIASNRLPLRGVVGCILSNELLDAFPVHQVTVRQGQLREVYVTLSDGDLETQTGGLSNPLLAQRLEGLGLELAEGQTVEINLAMDDWASDVAQSLESGFVLTIDYGRHAEELYSATERPQGTLTTFHNHLQTDRPLHRIGQQDMSAQVDFTSLARAGRSNGLELLGYAGQGAFLRNLGLSQMERRRPAGGPLQAQAALAGLRELTKPGGLGDFKVMALGKNVGTPELWGFHPSEQAAELTGSMPTPLPTPEHLNLLAGRYPSAESAFDLTWEELWPDDE